MAACRAGQGEASQGGAVGGTSRSASWRPRRCFGMSQVAVAAQPAPPSPVQHSPGRGLGAPTPTCPANTTHADCHHAPPSLVRKHSPLHTGTPAPLAGTRGWPAPAPRCAPPVGRGSSSDGGPAPADAPPPNSRVRGRPLGWAMRPWAHAAHAASGGVANLLKSCGRQPSVKGNLQQRAASGEGLARRRSGA